jgi:hypothetical protein
MMVKFTSLNTAVLFSFLLILLAAFAGCQEHDQVKSPWRLDPTYSDYLTIMASNYKEMTGHGSASMVDGMLIYKISNERTNMFSLDDLFKRESRFDSRDKEFIRSFLEAAQAKVFRPSGECKSDPNEATLHVILLDNTFMRAGYFLFMTCKTADSEYGVVQTLRGPSYYTKSLLPMIRSIDPVLYHDPQLPSVTH